MTTAQAKQDLTTLEKVYKNLQKTIPTKRKKLGIYNKRRKRKSNNQLRVTSNAIVRYLVLVDGVDIQAVKTKLLDVCQNLDERNYLVLDHGDFKVVIANNNIVNIFKNNNKREDNVD